MSSQVKDLSESLAQASADIAQASIVVRASEKQREQVNREEMNVAEQIQAVQTLQKQIDQFREQNKNVLETASNIAQLNAFASQLKQVQSQVDVNAEEGAQAAWASWEIKDGKEAKAHAALELAKFELGAQRSVQELRSAHILTEAHTASEAERRMQVSKETDKRAALDRELASSTLTTTVLSTASVGGAGARHVSSRLGSATTRAKSNAKRKKQRLRRLFLEKERLRMFLEGRRKESELTFRTEDTRIFEGGVSRALEFLSYHGNPEGSEFQNGAGVVLNRVATNLQKLAELLASKEAEGGTVSAFVSVRPDLLPLLQRDQDADASAIPVALIQHLALSKRVMQRITDRVCKIFGPDPSKSDLATCEPCEKMKLLRIRNSIPPSTRKDAPENNARQSRKNDGHSVAPALVLTKFTSAADHVVVSHEQEGKRGYTADVVSSLASSVEALRGRNEQKDEAASEQFLVEIRNMVTEILGTFSARQMSESSLTTYAETFTFLAGIYVSEVFASERSHSSSVSHDAGTGEEGDMEDVRDSAQKVVHDQRTVISIIGSLHRDLNTLRSEAEVASMVFQELLGNAKNSNSAAHQQECPSSVSLRAFLPVFRRRLHKIFAEASILAQSVQRIHMELFEVARRIETEEARMLECKRAQEEQSEEPNKVEEEEHKISTLREKSQLLFTDRDRAERKYVLAVRAMLEVFTKVLGHFLCGSDKEAVDTQVLMLDGKLAKFIQDRGYSDLDEVDQLSAAGDVGGRGGQQRRTNVLSSFFVAKDNEAGDRTDSRAAADNRGQVGATRMVWRNALEFSTDLHQGVRALLTRIAEIDFKLRQRAPAVALGVLAREARLERDEDVPLSTLEKLHHQVVVENVPLLGSYEGLQYGATALASADSRQKLHAAAFSAKKDGVVVARRTDKDDRENVFTEKHKSRLALFFSKTQVRKKEVLFFRSLEVLSALLSVLLHMLQCVKAAGQRTSFEQAQVKRIERVARFLHELFTDRFFADIRRAQAVVFLLDLSGESWLTLDLVDINEIKRLSGLEHQTGGQFFNSSAKKTNSHRDLLQLAAQQTQKFEQCADKSIANSNGKLFPNLGSLLRDVATHNWGVCLRAHLARKLALRRRRVEGASSVDDAVALELFDKVIEFFKKLRLLPPRMARIAAGDPDAWSGRGTGTAFLHSLHARIKEFDALWLQSKCEAPAHVVIPDYVVARESGQVSQSPGVDLLPAEVSALYYQLSTAWTEEMRSLDEGHSRSAAGARRMGTAAPASEDELALELEQRHALLGEGHKLNAALGDVAHVESSATQKSWWRQLALVGVVPGTDPPLTSSGNATASPPIVDTASSTLHQRFVDILTKSFQAKIADPLRKGCGMRADFLDRMHRPRVSRNNCAPSSRKPRNKRATSSS